MLPSSLQAQRSRKSPNRQVGDTSLQPTGATVPQIPQPAGWGLEFGHFMSSISIQNEVFSEVLMEQLRNRRFVYLTAQLGHDVEKRSSLRTVLSPLRLGQIMVRPARPKALQRCQQQQTIGS